MKHRLLPSLLLLAALCGCPAHGTPEGGQQKAMGTVSPAAEPGTGQVSGDADAAEEFRPPDWLIADPPITALFPPSGEVVTLGLKGSLERSRQLPARPLDEAEFIADARRAGTV